MAAAQQPQRPPLGQYSSTINRQHQEQPSLPEHIAKRVDPAYSNVLHTRVKEILQIQHDNFPGTQPVSFEAKHLTELEREDYFVCEKTDGIRYLLFFCHSSKGPAAFLFDRNRIWYYVPNLLFPVRGREKDFLRDTLMDGELVVDTEEDNRKIWRFLLFDLMALNGTPVTKRSFNTRLGMLQQEVLGPYNNRLRHINEQARAPFTIELKKMERAYGLHLVFEQMSRLKHSSDGVILTPVKYPYIPGTCDKLLKWKPPELNTVDFRISAKWSKEHKPIYSLEVLSHGVTYKFYDHFQPEPTLAAEWKNHLPDGRIAEFRYDPDWEVVIVEQGYAPETRKGGWRFVRFREDKDTANDENVVKKILRSIKDGITKEQLLEHMDRVRTAWKAREKGLPIPPPIPPPISAEKSNEATERSSSSMVTPTSATPAILPSPSVTNPSGSYFHARDSSSEQTSRSRQNSADLTATSKGDRRYSDTDVPTKVRSKFENHSLQQVPEELEEEEEGERGTNNSQSKREASPQAANAAERKRFKSWTGEERRQSIASNISGSSNRTNEERTDTTTTATTTTTNIIKDEVSDESTSTRRRKVSASFSSYEFHRPMQRSETSPELDTSRKMHRTEHRRPSQQDLQSPSWKNITGVPESNNNNSNINDKPASAPPKIRHSSSSNIHSLLTTSVEPNAARTSNAASSSGSSPVTDTQQQRRQEQQQQQPAPKRSNRAYDFATILQSNNETPARAEQPLQAERYAARPSVGQMQFINYHADGMTASKTGFVRTENVHNSPPPDWRHHPYATEPVVPPEHQRPHPYSPAVSDYPHATTTTATTATYYQAPPQPPPPPPSATRYGEPEPSRPYHHHHQQQQQPSESTQRDSQPRKKSSKAMLDFILN